MPFVPCRHLVVLLQSFGPALLTCAFALSSETMKPPLTASLEVKDQTWLDEDKQRKGKSLVWQRAFLAGTPLDLRCKARTLPLAAPSSKLGAVP
jgi:hypothetical protein